MPRFTRTLLCFALILIFPLAGMAQESIRFGVQAGGGLTSAYNYYPNKNKYASDAALVLPQNNPILSYSANLYISYPLNERFAVAVEPGFIQKGFMVEFVQSYDLMRNTTYLSFVQLPVLLEMKFDLPITFTFGPEFSYLVDAKRKSLDLNEKISLMGYYQKNRIDAGLQAGGYYSFSENWDVGLKAGGSLTSLEKYFITNVDGSSVIEVRKKNIYFNLFTRIVF